MARLKQGQGLFLLLIRAEVYDDQSGVTVLGDEHGFAVSVASFATSVFRWLMGRRAWRASWLHRGQEDREEIDRILVRRVSPRRIAHTLAPLLATAAQKSKKP